MIAPTGCEGGLSTSDSGFVHDIVVDQGCQVHHLDDDGGGDGGIGGATAAIAGQSDQEGPQLFALVGDGILSERHYFRNEFLNLLGQTVGQKA